MEVRSIESKRRGVGLEEEEEKGKKGRIYKIVRKGEIEGWPAFDCAWVDGMKLPAPPLLTSLFHLPLSLSSSLSLSLTHTHFLAQKCGEHHSEFLLHWECMEVFCVAQ